MIGETIGHLKIISELGRGGMGIVYLAEHITLNKKFVVKRLSPALTEDPQFRDRFYQEARNQAVLNHPNIVQATDFFEENQEFLFVMEYVEGMDLGKLIRSKGRLTEEEALPIFKGILEGLDFAHNEGIIHRDVKPPNIMIDKSGRPRIMDFGIAVMFGSKRLSSTGTAVGSPWYMSPEQIKNPSNIDHCTDVYSAGILLYEMLTGDVPFDGKSDFSVKEQQVNAPRPDPRKKNPEISDRLAEIILKAIDTNPDKRFQGCAEFLDHIKTYENSKRPTPKPQRKWPLFALIVIAISGVGAAVYMMTIPQPNSNDPDLKLKQTHKASVLYMDLASKEAAILCRQFIEIDLIRDRLPIARNIEDRDVEKKLMDQIREKEMNIRDGLSKYNDTIKELVALDKSVVEEEFHSYVNKIDKKKHPAQEAAERKKNLFIVQEHYQRYGNHKADIDRGDMIRACGGR